MKRISLFFIVFLSFISVSCEKKIIPPYPGSDDISLNEQTPEQLRISLPSENSAEKIPDSEPLNYEHPAAMWYTYMNYTDILKGKSETEFTDSVKNDFKKIIDSGINTLYLHVRTFGDSYYISDIFPEGEYYGMDYDPFEVMLNEGHKLGLSIHAWINPLRCQTEDQIKKLDSRYLIKKWYDDSEKNGKYIVRSGDNFYLNPAYPEVISLITSGVNEIIGNYPVDGIHIDDYFYPTTDENFDAEAFSASESNDLIQWRRENISRMVKSIYDTVKSRNEKLLFGISPQGNINSDMNVLCADVEKWASEPGYCDYIVPQIYYGFKNENCPFVKTVEQWKELNSCGAVKLIIGLCTYKIGNEDKWAGSGKDEWKENRNIVCDQIKYCIENNLDFALYSFRSTFSDEISGERQAISEILRAERQYAAINPDSKGDSQ